MMLKEFEMKIKILCTAIFITVFLGACDKKEYPPVDIDKKPVLGEFKTHDLPAAKKFELNNGLQVYLLENREVPLVSVTAVFNMGLVDEEPELRGLSKYTLEMMGSGSTQKNAQKFAEELEFNGTFLHSDVDYESSAITMVVLKENLDNAMALFSDAVLHPAFSAEEWEKIERREIDNIKSQQTKPEEKVDELFRNVLYGAHPYGVSPQPEISTIQRISVEKMRMYYEKYVNVENSSLILSGDISPKSAKQLLSLYFQDFKHGKKNRHDYKTPPEKNLVKIHFISLPKTEKAYIRLGLVGIDFQSPLLYGALVMNEILSGNPSSRLQHLFNDSLEWKNKSYTRLELRNRPGPFYFSGVFAKEKVDSVIVNLLKEFKKIKMHPPSAGELRHAKNLLISKFYMQTETSYEIARIVRHIIEYNLSRDILETYGQKINLVKAVDVQNAARKIIDPERMSIVIAGNPSMIDQLRKIAPVLVYDEELQRK